MFFIKNIILVAGVLAALFDATTASNPIGAKKLMKRDKQRNKAATEYAHASQHQEDSVHSHMLMAAASKSMAAVHRTEVGKARTAAKAAEHADIAGRYDADHAHHIAQAHALHHISQLPANSLEAKHHLAEYQLRQTDHHLNMATRPEHKDRHQDHTARAGAYIAASGHNIHNQTPGFQHHPEVHPHPQVAITPARISTKTN